MPRPLQLSSQQTLTSPSSTRTPSRMRDHPAQYAGTRVIRRSSASPTSSHPAPRRLVGRRWAPLSTISTSTLYLLARNRRYEAAKPSSASAARALAASSSRPSKREVEQALADTLARCGLLTDDNKNNRNRRVLMALAASTPTHHADRIIAVSNSSPMMRSSTTPRGALGKFANPHLHGVLRPCAE